ncbi:uncharacterized protein LOC130440962 [Diorhabda sublineata]|uniref:uncharacterized protein LOC130440962 n=1 Tax=Diorhabda sublineata TaxID=1163346 RepID=UPI0024E0F9BA|nr:uncharacterized protein LOC130440962 [Diorhabda sublineata]
MKYIYISFLVYILIGYITPSVTGDDALNLSALSQKCECNDNIDEILCKIAETATLILNLRSKLTRIVIETKDLTKELAQNTDELKEIDEEVSNMQQQQSDADATIKEHSNVIEDINAAVEGIVDDQEETGCVLSQDTCELNQLRRILISYVNCQCVRDSQSSTTVSP